MKTDWSVRPLYKILNVHTHMVDVCFSVEFFFFMFVSWAVWALSTHCLPVFASPSSLGHAHLNLHSVLINSAVSHLLVSPSLCSELGPVERCAFLQATSGSLQTRFLTLRQVCRFAVTRLFLVFV